ncbi:MAG: hypothetical protein V1836_02420 [Candidatus Aenigmatarchaeota archaeon]
MPHHRSKEESAKHVVVWVLGALSAMIGAWIMGHLDKTVGVSDAGYMTAFFVAFILFLGTGWFWISVAIAVKE